MNAMASLVCLFYSAKEKVCNAHTSAFVCIQSKRWEQILYGQWKAQNINKRWRAYDPKNKTAQPDRTILELRVFELCVANFSTLWKGCKFRQVLNGRLAHK